MARYRQDANNDCLTYSAYVGFEVIADDAEEVSTPTAHSAGYFAELTHRHSVYTLVVW
jgi:hypothetical protein